MVIGGGFDEEALDVALGCCADGVESSGDDFGVVEYEQVGGSEEFGEVGDVVVGGW